MGINRDISSSIEACIAFLQQLLRERVSSFFNATNFDESWFNSAFLDQFPASPIFDFKKNYDLSDEEFILVITALCPHIDPTFIDKQVSEALPNGGEFPEIGGMRGKNHRGFIPTIQTFLFIIAGTEVRKNIEARELFSGDHPLIANGIIIIEDAQPGEPLTSCKISLSEEFVGLFLTGKSRIPNYAASFPAKKLSTSLEWQDMVLNDDIRDGINDMLSWLKNRKKLVEENNRYHQNDHGYKCLFYGPVGTGKSSAAALFGKEVNIDIFQLDIAMLTSMYIGETEKNIDNLFRRAESHHWILVVDDADALYTKPTEGPENYRGLGIPERSYLLQRIEAYTGIIIFEARSRDKMDDGFLKQLDSRIYFSLPGFEQRKLLWNIHLPHFIHVDISVNLDAISEKYALSGKEILNSAEKIYFKVAERGDNMLKQEDIVAILDRRFKAREEKAAVETVPGSDDRTAKTTPEKKDIGIFISYSSKDRDLRDLITEGVSAHLSNKATIKYSVWEDRQIDLGANWQEEITKALEASDVAILLVSASFVSSDYIGRNELSEFLKMKKDKGYLMLPVLVRNYNFSDFEKLSNLNFFKTYFTEYGFNQPATRHKLLPFDILGDDPKTTEKQFQDYYFKLADYIHTAVSNHFK